MKSSLITFPLLTSSLSQGNLSAHDDASRHNGISHSLFHIFLALYASSNIKETLTCEGIVDEMARIVPHSNYDDRFIIAAREVARGQGGELHTISAITGGLLAQEIVKLVTGQYVPIDNVCVYDGINSRSQVFRFSDR